MDPASLYLQLYSLRRETATDPEGALRQVRSLGYDGVELAGDYGWSADQWRGLLDETGLTVISGHTGLETLETDLDRTLDFYRALGCSRLAVSSLPGDKQIPERYHEGARRLDAVGRKFAEHGFTLGYHNHAYEFDTLDGSGGKCGMDILLEKTDPSVVGFEFDSYWIEYGGRNALEFVRLHADRVFALHAKDLRKRDRTDVPAGQGDVDFHRLLPMATAADWPVIVEYESEPAPEGVRQAAEFLRPLLG